MIERADLDSDTYIAELSKMGILSLTNDHTKGEFEVNARGTYDLLVFLHQHAAQIYRAVRKPKEVFPYENHHQTITLPVGNDGEATRPSELNRVLYGNQNDPLLLFVHDLVDAWAEVAYNGPAIVTRIESVAWAQDQHEAEEPEVLRSLLTWQIPEGTPDQAWKVTVWPQWGYKDFMPNHVYVHRYGQQLWTARSEWQNGPPHFLWLPDNEEEES
jgi:hypothetical protein